MTLYTVVGRNKYDYVKQETGERKQGGSITYLSKSGTGGRDGYTAIEVPVPTEDLSTFDKIPALYDIEFELVPVRGTGGAQSLRQVFQAATQIATVDLDFPQKYLQSQKKQAA